MALITITGPAAEPVTAAEVKTAARIDGAEFDSQISMLITAFRLQAEHQQGRRFITQTVELVLDEFPSDGDVDLMLPNVKSITSVKYFDNDGVQQTLDPAAYALDSDSAPGWLLVVDSWPSTKDAANAVRIRYVVGYGDAAADVPSNTRLWMIAQSCAALDNQSPPAWLDRLLDEGMVHRG